MAARVRAVYYDDDSDPLSRALRPPPNETPQQATERMVKHKAASLVSREIDERILEDKKALERKHNAVKILLLGQSESGKSTTLRNFQLTFCPAQFRSEIAVWRTVIQLNIIRSMKSILDVLQPELESASISPPTSPTLIPIGSSRTPRPNTAQTTTTVTFAKNNELSTPPRLTDTHRRLCKRLSPLLAIEATLTRKLLAIPEFAPVLPSPSSAKAGATLGDPPTITNTNTTTTQPALTVRAGSGWKRLLQLAIRAPVEAEGGSRRSAMADRNRDDPTSVLAACKQDIISLWTDPVLKEILKERGVRPENASGFFLDDVDRIAVHTYEPTPNDILRARIRTLGIEEHHFSIEGGLLGSVHQRDWYIYDVGGSRSMRERWAPFFDDVNAIIFLAPLTFDQYLEETPSVNRLKDTLLLWQQVCRNRLLANTTLILFLNKIDVLTRSLEEGVKVKKFIPSYDKANDLKTVVTYFRNAFIEYHKKLSLSKRRIMYVHETSVVDAIMMRKILHTVRDSILRANLESGDLIL